MRPLLHPSLVNGRFGDPALYVQTQFEARADIFDLGDISALSPRAIQRIDHVYVSHTHVDHFIGFDHLLRLNVGREKTIKLYGPAGFIDRIDHKLQAYSWNLVDRYACDLVLLVSEIIATGMRRNARFRLKTAFAREDCGTVEATGSTIVREPAFLVSAAILEHRTPCIGYAIKETAHVNVWKTRLAALNLQVGPWLRTLKRSILEGADDNFPIPVDGALALPLGKLRQAVTVTEGQKIGYVTDVVDNDANREAIGELVRDADLLFIETAFAEADAALAAARAHLTTQQAGQIARAAGVRRVEPFHFSPRYTGEEARMLREVADAFGNRTGGDESSDGSPARV